MLAEVFGVFGSAFASALIPLINIEAIVVLSAGKGSAPAWLLVAGATVGQMLGKILWYYGGRELDRFPFVARKMAKPRMAAALERWRARCEGRPWFMAGLLLVSASVGLPPYAVLAVLAGTLRVHFWVFFTTGLAGRAVRFAAVVGGTEAILHWW